MGSEMRTERRVSETAQLLDLYGASRDVAARDDLVAEHMPLVYWLCRRFFHSGERPEDLYQVGSVGLLKAVEKYNPAVGSNFRAFAIPLIVGEIKNYFRDHGWAVKVPRKLQRQRLTVARAVEVLNQQLGREPTIMEIVGATGFSEEEVYETFEVRNYGKPLSLDALHNGYDSSDLPTILDTLGKEDSQLEGLTDKIDVTNALHCLDTRERTIICLKFYDGLPQTEIAKRLGISQMHVSRLQRIALRKLKLVLLR